MSAAVGTRLEPIPMEPSMEQPRHHVTRTLAPPEARVSRVLVVDDAPGIGHFLHSAFTEAGASVCAVCAVSPQTGQDRVAMPATAAGDRLHKREYSSA